MIARYTFFNFRFCTHSSCSVLSLKPSLNSVCCTNVRSKYIWTRAFDSETRHRLQRVDVRKIIIFERKKNDRNVLRPHRDPVIWRLNDNPITIAVCSNRIRIELSRTLVTFLSVLINLTSKRIINVHREFRMHTIRVYSDVQIPFAIQTFQTQLLIENAARFMSRLTLSLCF